MPHLQIGIAKRISMKGKVAALLLVLLWQVDCAISTDIQNDIPLPVSQLKSMTTKFVSCKMDCALACAVTPGCRMVEFKMVAEENGLHNCTLFGTDKYTEQEKLKQKYPCPEKKKSPCKKNLCLNDGRCVPHENKMDYHCECKIGYKGEKCQYEIRGQNCAEIHKSGERRNGVYKAELDNQKTIQVYCDMISDGGGWTLIGRFSNNDTKNWMRDDGSWWYDVTEAQGNVTNTSVNQDMISPAFWSVKGSEIKITRSDDPTHTALLRTTSNCLGSRTFRSMITSYGDFRNGKKVWAYDKCLGSCSVVYGGNFSSTDGFSQANCSSNIQSSDGIGFWCNWGFDGAVMMIGGGGRTCARADHGIGITEENTPRFVTNTVECDFGDILGEPGNSCPTSSYALNLWIH